MNLKIGDIVRFKSLEEIHNLQEQHKLYYGWGEHMDYLCGQFRLITTEILTRPKYGGKEVFVENGFYVSPDMIDLVGDEEKKTMFKIGDEIKFKDAETMEQLEKEHKVKCSWQKYMEFLCGTKTKLTEGNVENIYNGSDYVWAYSRFDNESPLYISTDMFELVS